MNFQRGIRWESMLGHTLELWPESDRLEEHCNRFHGEGSFIQRSTHAPIDQCLWNITPKHAYTDLHTDRGLDTVTFLVGGRKIWIL
jgi:hypothetical protein